MACYLSLLVLGTLLLDVVLAQSAIAFNIPSEVTAAVAGNVGTEFTNPFSVVNGVSSTSATPTPTTLSTSTTPSSTSPITSSTSSTSAKSTSSSSTSKPSTTTSSSHSTSAKKTSSASSSSSSSAAPSSTSSPTPTASAKPAEHGLTGSTKMGVGIGVPFGVISLALIAYLFYRKGRQMAQSRERHHAIVAAQGLYPQKDESNSTESETAATPTVAPDSEPIRIPELHGEHVPPNSRELPGSPFPRREELLSP